MFQSASTFHLDSFKDNGIVFVLGSYFFRLLSILRNSFAFHIGKQLFFVHTENGTHFVHSSIIYVSL